MKFFLKLKHKIGGLSYIETIIGVGIFALIALMLYSTYSRVFIVARAAQSRVNAVALAEEQFELARNLPFNSVGTIGGIPSGSLRQVQTLTRGGMTFIATTTVRNIDQSFDGTAGGAPNDLSPADNKLVEIDITCTTCVNFRPLILTTWVGPKNLEGSSTNGSLFVKVIDASGLAVQGASVIVISTSSTPSINVNDLTATSGMLQLVDAPPGVESYRVIVGKAGYSADQSYARTATTANPVITDPTVAVQTVTQVTFSIDRTATLNFSSVSPSCAAIGNVNLRLNGAKLIATAPNVLKYDRYTKTDASGLLTLNNIEWDNYTIAATSSTYDLAGVMPLQPVSITPGATQNIQLVMVPKSNPAVLITVKDVATGLPVSGATVTLEMGGASTTQTTGRGFLGQTDWSGGSGQSDFLNANQYQSDDTNVDAASSPGNVKLQSILGSYASNGTLYSSTFDTGSLSNFYQFVSNPSGQPVAVGSTPVQFQIATGNSTSSWTYLGPDGTNATYYNSTTTDIAAVNNGNRYLRYKMLLSTASTTFTPTVSDAQFTFTSNCVPPGQVLFQGLANGIYNITVEKTGYTTETDTVTITAASTWQEMQETIGP